MTPMDHRRIVLNTCDHESFLPNIRPPPDVGTHRMESVKREQPPPAEFRTNSQGVRDIRSPDIDVGVDRMSKQGDSNTAVPAFRPPPLSEHQRQEERKRPPPRRTPSPPRGLPDEVAPADPRFRGSGTSPARRVQRVSAGSRPRSVQDRSRSSGSRPASRRRPPSREIPAGSVVDSGHPSRSEASSSPRLPRSEADWEVVTPINLSPSQLPHRGGPRRG